MSRKTIELVKAPPFKIIDFPCEASLGHKIATNRKEFVKIFNYVNKYSQTGMYNSIYAFDVVVNDRKPVPETARVDKILLDFDLEDFGYDKFRCWLNAFTVHVFCENLDIQHGINFSGNGYHVYIGVDSRGIKDEDKNSFIISLINFVARLTGVIVCESCTQSPTARIIRTVGSYYVKNITKKKSNKKEAEENDDDNAAKKAKKEAYLKWLEDNGYSERYCVNLDHETIHAGYRAIYNKSVEQEFDFKVIGSKRVLLESIDKTVESKNHVIDDKKIAEISKIDDSEIKDVYSLLEKFMIFKKDIPPCVRLLLKNKDARFYERGALVTYLANLDLSLKEIEFILKHVLSKKRFYHAYREEPRSPDYTAREAQAGNYKIGCGKFQTLGYCDSEKCKKKRIFPFLD